MQNIKTNLEGDDIVIRVNRYTDLGMAKSGKVILVANSNGFAPIEGTNLTMTMVVFKKPSK